jgi:putative flippase GtrA
MWNRLPALAGYFVASCVGLATDASLLMVLSRLCGVPYLLAATLSFMLGGVVVYRLCMALGFNSANGADGSGRPLEMVVFVLLGGVGVVINAIVIAVAVELVHAPLLAAKAAAAGCTFFTNYALRRRLVFTRGYRIEPVSERGLAP